MTNVFVTDKVIKTKFILSAWCFYMFYSVNIINHKPKYPGEIHSINIYPLFVHTSANYLIIVTYLNRTK